MNVTTCKYRYEFFFIYTCFKVKYFRSTLAGVVFHSETADLSFSNSSLKCHTTTLFRNRTLVVTFDSLWTSDLCKSGQKDNFNLSVTFLMLTHILSDWKVIICIPIIHRMCKSNL